MTTNKLCPLMAGLGGGGITSAKWSCRKERCAWYVDRGLAYPEGGCAITKIAAKLEDIARDIDWYPHNKEEDETDDSTTHVCGIHARPYHREEGTKMTKTLECSRRTCTNEAKYATLRMPDHKIVYAPRFGYRVVCAEHVEEERYLVFEDEYMVVPLEDLEYSDILDHHTQEEDNEDDEWSALL